MKTRILCPICGDPVYEAEALIDKLQHAGEQLIRYAEVVIDDNRTSIEYTSGVELEWLQAIKQWKASGGNMPAGFDLNTRANT